MANKKEYQFSVDVNGNISGLNKAMKEATALVRRTADTIRNIDTAIQSDPNDINLLKTKQELYAREIKETTKALKDLKEIQKALVRDVEGKKDYGLEYSKLEKEIKSYKAQLKELQKQQKAVNLEISNFTFNQKMRKLADDLDKVRNASEKIKQSLSNVGEQLKYDPYNVDLYAQKQELLSQKLKNVNEELEVLNKRKELLSNDLFRKKTEEEIQVVEQNELAIQKLNAQKEHLEYIIRNRLSPSMQVFAKKTQELSEGLGRVSYNTQRLSAFFSGLLVDSFNAAKHYESNVAKIEKVTGKLSDTVVNDLKDMAVETGNSFEEIADYASISGALGLAEDEIVSFTKAMVDLNAVSGGAFSGEYGAKGVAVFLKQLGLTTDYAENFASAIARLGDKYADIGDETVGLATKLTGLNSIIKTDQFELLGLSAVMADLGLSGDTSANAINRAFLQIEKVLAGGVKNADEKLNAMARTANMSSKEFRNAWNTNSMDTFLRFVDGLNSSVFNEINDSIVNSTGNIEKYASALGLTVDEFKMLWSQDSKKAFEQLIDNLESIGDEGVSASKVLSQMGIASVNTAQTLLRLSGSGNEVRSAIELANKAWNENTAIQEKTNILYNTTQSKLDSFNESLNQLKASLVDSVLPSLKAGIDFGTKLSQTFSKLDPTTRQLALAFVAIGSRISPVSRGLSEFTRNMFKVDKVTGEFIKTAGKFSLTWSAKISLIMAGVAAVTALGLAFVAAWKNTERYKLLDGINENYQRSVETLSQMKKNLEDSALAYDLQNASIKRQMTTIDELNRKLQSGNLTEEESNQTKEELIKKIDELNTAMGGSFYYWDETKQKIVNEKGEIIGADGLIGAYSSLELARKRAFVLDNMENDYLESIKIEKQAVEDITKLRKQFKEDMQNTGYLEYFGADFVNNAQRWASELKNAEGDASKIDRSLQNWVNSLNEMESEALINIGNMWRESNSDLEKQVELLDGAGKVIKNYTDIQNASEENLGKLLYAYSSYGTTSMKDAMEEANKQIKEANEQLADRRTLFPKEIEYWEDVKSRAEEFLSLTKQINDEGNPNDTLKNHTEAVRKGLEEVRSSYDSFYGSNGEFVVKFNESTLAQETAQKTMIDNSTKYMVDSYSVAASTIQQDFAQRTLRMNGVVNLRSSDGRSLNSYNLMNSSGYGDTLLENLSRSFRTPMSKGFASGGMMSSNSIVVNNSFTINGSEGLTETALLGYADIITDRVNENLGRMI